MPKGIYKKGSTKTGGIRLQKQIAMGKKLKKTGTSKRTGSGGSHKKGSHNKMGY